MMNPLIVFFINNVSSVVVRMSVTEREVINGCINLTNVIFYNLHCLNLREREKERKIQNFNLNICKSFLLYLSLFLSFFILIYGATYWSKYLKKTCVSNRMPPNPPKRPIYILYNIHICMYMRGILNRF